MERSTDELAGDLFEPSALRLADNTSLLPTIVIMLLGWQCGEC